MIADKLREGAKEGDWGCAVLFHATAEQLADLVEAVENYLDSIGAKEEIKMFRQLIPMSNSGKRLLELEDAYIALRERVEK